MPRRQRAGFRLIHVSFPLSECAQFILDSRERQPADFPKRQREGTLGSWPSSHREPVRGIEKGRSAVALGFRVF